MKIGEVAKRAGVSARSLRYYEEQGLLSPDRHANGYRDYGEDSVEIATKIAHLIHSGIPTDAIRVILPCMPGSNSILICDDIASELNRVHAQLDAQITSLRESRDSVKGILDSQPRTVGSRRE